MVIDVPDEWGEVVLELDRQEYNNNHRETHRHCSLDAYDADHNLVASGDDIEQEFVQKEDNEKLYRALDELELRQRELITRIIINNETIKSTSLSPDLNAAASPEARKSPHATKPQLQLLSKHPRAKQL